MRTTKRSSSLGLILLMLIFSVSCEKEDAISTGERLFYNTKTNKTINLNDQQQVNDLAKALSKETGDFKLLGDASIVDLTDSKGSFKALSVKYQVGQRITKMIVPINEMPFDKTGLKSGKGTAGNTYYVVDTDACEMKCNSVYPCSSCTQEIIERCKSQTCTCNNMSDGCSASIIFND